MDAKYFDCIKKELSAFFTENNIEDKDGYFANEKKAIKIDFDDNRKMFTLSVADITDRIVGDYREINAWLFDDSYNEKDATSVGLDFAISLRKEFGIKNTRTVNSIIDLPSASKDGAINISAFSKKILDVFPALKDEYKNYIAVYGNFLYLSFFGEHLRPRLIRLFEEGTKKQIKKFYDVLEDAFQKGDRDTANCVIIILASAGYKNVKVTDSIKEMLKVNNNFLSAFVSFVPFFASNNKLVKTMIKE